MKSMMLRILILIVIITQWLVSQAQPKSYTYNEDQLALAGGTTLVSDPSAQGGSAIFRPASSSSDTYWFGPYTNIPAGSYTVQVRLKVASNAPDAFLFVIDISNPSGGTYANLDIKPNMFRESNRWQIFSFPVIVPVATTQLEFRGMAFQSGITDVFLDYVNVVQSDTRGFYSNEYTLDGMGNMGIGTNSPLAKLGVNGLIRSKEVKVETTNWPDYVFNPTYNLPSLSVVKAYINKNQHLPEMPSEMDVAKDGISLGEMNKLLVKKVEELTLYLIEKESKDKKMCKRIKSIERRLSKSNRLSHHKKMTNK
jgi:hypothetical protein